MISERHKTNNLVTIWIFNCLLLVLLLATTGPVPTRASDEVYEVLPQSTTTTTTIKSGNRQDEVNVLAFVTPDVTPGE